MKLRKKKKKTIDDNMFVCVHNLYGCKWFYNVKVIPFIALRI